MLSSGDVLIFKQLLKLQFVKIYKHTLESEINIRLSMFIEFWDFFLWLCTNYLLIEEGATSILDSRVVVSDTIFYTLYSFSQIWQLEDWILNKVEQKSVESL